MQMVSKNHVKARAVFARSLNVLGCQLGAAKSREQDFPKKTSRFFEVHWTNDTHMDTVAPSNRACGLCKTGTIQGSVDKFNKSAWMATNGRKNPGARFSEKKRPGFLKFIGSVTAIWEL